MGQPTSGIIILIYYYFHRYHSFIAFYIYYDYGRSNIDSIIHQLFFPRSFIAFYGYFEYRTSSSSLPLEGINNSTATDSSRSTSTVRRQVLRHRVSPCRSAYFASPWWLLTLIS